MMASKTETAGASFAQLAYERYSRVLRNYLMNRVRNREDARELAQEVWTRLLRVTEPGKVLEPRRYVYRVAAHVVCEFQDLKRRNPVCFDSEMFAQTAAELPEANDGIERLKAQSDVLRALQPLSPMLRDIILLRLREGLDYREIGERLGITAGTAKRYFFSAMELARKAWAGGVTT
jgi:RNA polymerase sigma factor (sigma-70 family)